MKGFRFRLESVLGVRRFEEERAQRERAAAEADLVRAQSEQSSRSEGLRDAVRSFAGRIADGVPAAWARSAAAGLEALGSGLEGAETGVRQARHALAQRRALARTARSRLRALERLRARAAAAHQRELLSHAQRELDEIAVLRSRRSP